MAASCKKCDPHEICEECPEWIFTLADLIMCMMGLFVLLWVLKPSPNSKDQPPQPSDDWVKVAAAVREAFGYMPDPHSKDPVDVHLLLKRLERLKPMNNPGEGGQTKVQRRGAEGTDPEVTNIRAGKQATVGGRVLFDAGSAKLTPEALRQLDQIAEQIRGHRNISLIKGHTSLDDFGESTAAHEKLQLSLRRAEAVAQYLTRLGVDPEILRVQGCSTFEPVVQRAYNTDGQASNRRVEVEATATLVEEFQDPLTAKAPPASSPASTTSSAAPVTQEAHTH